MFYYHTNKTKKVELSNGNWKEIERVEVNLENKEPQKLVEEVIENNDSTEKTNGNALTEIEEKANGESKDMTERVEDRKVWLYLLFEIIVHAIAHFIEMFVTNKLEKMRN